MEANNSIIIWKKNTRTGKLWVQKEEQDAEKGETIELIQTDRDASHKTDKLPGAQVSFRESKAQGSKEIMLRERGRKKKVTSYAFLSNSEEQTDLQIYETVALWATVLGNRTFLAGIIYD